MRPPSAAPAIVWICAIALATSAWAQSAPATTPIDEAQRHLYSARFEEAAATAARLIAAEPDNLAAYEVRTSALHFQIRRLVGDSKDKKTALARCTDCPALLAAFLDDVNRGRAVARERIAKDAMDHEASFFLGKLDLSYLWLQLSTVDRKTGWKEYWEAKKVLEDLIEHDPMHVRARTARAWMDYIVGTRVPWGTRWLMGGGSKSRGLKMVREASATPTDYYTQVEAQFALQEMLTREGKRDEAVAMAKELLVKFPDNKDLTKFVESGGKPTTAGG
jgi:tetratricopeptide (TPR) repeat protein